MSIFARVHAFSEARALEEAQQRIAELEAELARLRHLRALDEGPEFWIRFHGNYRRIAAGELDWIEAERDYVRLHTAECSFLHHGSLRALEARLDPSAFRRVHRSAIVRWDRAREVRRDPRGLWVVTGLGARVRVGRTFAAGLLAALG